VRNPEGDPVAEVASPVVPGPDDPTVEGSDLVEARPGWRVRLFGSHLFFRLWCAQVVSAMGDWIGFLAIASLAQRIGAGSGETAIGLVMSARILPGFFLASVGGVLVDRWDRKKVMVVCDLGRAGTLALLPFVDSVWGLVVASLVLEVFTLLWSPAKEASVPNLVPPEHLTTANSLSLVAAYGTFPFASALFALLAKVAEWLGGFEALSFFEADQESVGFYFDVLTFCLSALIISRLALPHLTRRDREAEHEGRGVDWAQAFHELKEGWHFIFINPVVRAVNVGLATGLIGGAMVVPLGPVFSDEVLGTGPAGFGVLTTALGLGVALGVLGLSVLQKRLPKAQVFTASLLVAGVALVFAATSATLWLASVGITVLGVCAGSVYVLGFTLLHENVTDELRGRIFSALYTLVRLCVLIAFAAGPLLSGQLDKLSHRFLDAELDLIGGSLFLPGVRITLWLGGLIILAAGFLALRSVRAAPVAGAAASGEGRGEPTPEPV
jgi:dTMP kinase